MAPNGPVARHSTWRPGVLRERQDFVTESCSSAHRRSPAGLQNFHATFIHWEDTSTAIRRALATLLIGSLVLVAAWLSQSAAGTVEQLGLMGFDEPRAHLIAALTLGATAAAVAVLITGDRGAGTLLGFFGLAAFFGATFSEETKTALRSSGLAGVFDPIGYALSIFTFVFMSLVFAWAAGTLALEVRRNLVGTWRRARSSRRSAHGRRQVSGRIAGTAVLAIALFVGFSLFAQMINYTPDIAFVRDGPAIGGLTGGLNLPTPDPQASGGIDASPTPRPSPTPFVPGGSPPNPSLFPAKPIQAGGTISLTPGAVADLTSGHFPPNVGTMREDHFTMPAPWTGGYATTVDIYVRVPANYDPDHVRYPAVYVTPNPYADWTDAVRLHATVDALEASGDLPPMLYIFAPATGGPHPVTECVDSKDGLQHWDTFMSSTLIAYIDSHYATIASAAARTIMGDSQGGYCAADLLLRHPDVWNQEISFVGFYDAAARNSSHTSGSEVFGGDQAMMDAYSPITIAPKLSPEIRNTLYFCLIGLSSEDFYGPELDRFTRILDQNSYARTVIQTPFGHSWKTEATYLPNALSLIAARLVKQGVLQ